MTTASRKGADANLRGRFKEYNRSEIGVLDNEIEAAYGNKRQNPCESAVRSLINKIPTLRKHFNRLQKKGKFDLKYLALKQQQGNK